MGGECWALGVVRCALCVVRCALCVVRWGLGVGRWVVRRLSTVGPTDLIVAIWPHNGYFLMRRCCRPDPDIALALALAFGGPVSPVGQGRGGLTVDADGDALSCHHVHLERQVGGVGGVGGISRDYKARKRGKSHNVQLRTSRNTML